MLNCISIENGLRLVGPSQRKPVTTKAPQNDILTEQKKIPRTEVQNQLKSTFGSLLWNNRLKPTEKGLRYDGSTHQATPVLLAAH